MLDARKPSPAVGERLYSVRKFAEVLTLKESTVRAHILRRKVAFIKIGRSVRIPESELERILDEGYVPARGRD